jgi:hypothetical protein
MSDQKLREQFEQYWFATYKEDIADKDFPGAYPETAWKAFMEGFTLAEDTKDVR